MENSFGLFDSTDADVSTSEPSLLLLNDDCLIHIFKRLELLDFVNLSKTSLRLKNVAGDTFVRKFKSIVIDDKYAEHPTHPTCVKVTKQQFSDVLSVIGGRVLSIEICDGYDFILRTVTNKCKNVNSLALFYSKCSLDMSPQLQEFKNLKELKIYDCEISKKKLRQIFINNPGIESLEYDWAYKGFVKLLRLLPKLKSLSLDRMDGLGLNKVPNLFHLKEVTKFKFGSFVNCNKFLIELSTKWKLAELYFHCDTNDETFNSIKLFENLEYLEVGNMERSWTLPEHTVFPPNLKSISFYNIHLTYRTLASMVKKLKWLDIIKTNSGELQTNSNLLVVLISLNLKAGPYDDDDDEKISGIVTALCPVLQQRTLKIFYSKRRSRDERKVSESTNLPY